MQRVIPMSAAMDALLGGGPEAVQALGARFVARRLGPVWASWLGEGPARAVTPRMLMRVLGWREADALAALAGLSTGQFLERMARLLPAAVRRQAGGAAPVRAPAVDAAPPATERCFGGGGR